MDTVMGGRNGGATGSGGGGGSSGGSTESSVISKEEVVVEQVEVSDESELELGLGLSLGNNNNNNNNNKIQSFFKTKDLPSPPSASSSSLVNPSSNNHNISVGTKRPASPTSISQVVGWPPIRMNRMNSMANQAKSVTTGENNSDINDIKRKNMIFGSDEKGNAKSEDKVPSKSCLFVKVNMDGTPIGRKVDLNAHPSYELLAQTLEEMFINNAIEKSNGEELILMPKGKRSSKLLDGSSDYVLTYEDKDGDWMLVGDVPWGMFLSSVKRLRIMRTSEANGLAPRSEDRTAKQRSRPI